MKLNPHNIRSFLFVLLFVMPAVLFAQTRIVTVRQEDPVWPCANCYTNRFTDIQSGVSVILNRTKEFKKQHISCFKIEVLISDSLIACYAVAPDRASPVIPIPPGIYTVIAKADNESMEIKNVVIAENKSVYLSFYFSKKKEKRKK